MHAHVLDRDVFERVVERSLGCTRDEFGGGGDTHPVELEQLENAVAEEMLDDRLLSRDILNQSLPMASEGEVTLLVGHDVDQATSEAGVGVGEAQQGEGHQLEGLQLVVGHRVQQAAARARLAGARCDPGVCLVHALNFDVRRRPTTHGLPVE